MSSESSLSPHVTCAESKCLPFGDYVLVDSCSENKTVSENISYSLEIADELIYGRSSNECFGSEEFFYCLHIRYGLPGFQWLHHGRLRSRKKTKQKSSNE